MSFIKSSSSGKPQVQKNIAFCTLLGGLLPDDDILITDLFNHFDNKVREQEKSISREALSNVHGDWYEWLLAIAAWNYTAENPNANLALLLPNVIQFDVSTLYVERLNKLIDDLRNKVITVSGVQLITSNPDFVIVNRDLVNQYFGNIEPITKISTTSLSNLETMYQRFINKCDYEQIEGYISVKTSLRPDRRLQIPHEGSLMKALYAHLQTREWITNPKGLKYYAIATRMTPPDRSALKTVATHSLTTVFSLPQAAVDNVFEVNSLKQAKQAFSSILV
ncbi:Cfr10I/Bse634I family restriction endonuclease [Haliscomenobacter hydrossis]|uniref:Type II site-specific deoxyribonuclease n=1 Tax=Haliscomenobacter hydrossis (strain ATCC 27775 / DSM 1100 / LMG 10767 / O) TaxID=760192 RepID=F4KRY3_HALH1|nr:Cfr10I/Bse634I family restriction endonuclease [Haliscomenobacter hydrossis]AEE51070.1 Type II site-specific deoxyribonuclease [Haliscomenobacter hydrossis DSM 1100]